MAAIDPLGLVITNVGLSAFTRAQLGEDIDLTIATVGFTATAFSPAPTLTALPGEVKRRATVAGQATGPDTIHMVVRDGSTDAYQVCGFGLFLADGTLFAVYGQPTVMLEKAVASTALLALDLRFPPGQVAAITFGDTNFLNPAATETVAGVVEIATAAEVAAGVDDGRAVSPQKLKKRLADLTAALAVPVGTITLFQGAAAPAGWAICNGQEVARSDGAGIITTPDLRGRVAVGATDARPPGTTFGQSTVNIDTRSSPAGAGLTTSEQSTYAGNGTQQGVKSVTLTDPGHTHSVAVDVTQPSIALHYIMKI